MASYGAAKFLSQLAPQIVRAEIPHAIDIQEFTKNTDIVGQYIETSIRQFVRKYLSPIRVSTGGVIDENQTPGASIAQLDMIAWIPCPVAAIFEIGEFGLIPRSSCLGILEVKSSAYPGAVKKLNEMTKPAFVAPLTGPVENFEKPLSDKSVFALGVVALLKEDQKSNGKLQRLRDNGRVSVIYEQVETRFVPQEPDIYRLVNFLGILRFRASKRDGNIGINQSQIAKS